MVNIKNNFTYRDYSDFIIIYSRINERYLLIRDVYADFFRWLYIRGYSIEQTIYAAMDDYDVDYTIANRDIKEFCKNFERYINFSDPPHEGLSNQIRRNEIFDVMTECEIPFSATVEVTDSCNLRCIHCYRGPRRQSYWNITQFESLLEQLYELGTLHLTMTGGETFENPYIDDFLKLASKWGFVVSIQTNATLINEAHLEAIQSNIVNDVSVSVYSANEIVHDEITRQRGSLMATIKGIRKLLSAGIPVSINSPIMTINRDSMMGLRALGRSLGIPVKFALKIIPSQDENGHTQDLNAFSKDYIKNGIKNPNIHLYGDVLPSIRRTRAHEKYCQTGFRSITFDAQGNLIICNAYRKKCGNLNESTVRALWRHSKELNNWRMIVSKVNDRCKKCEAYAYCEPCPAHYYTLTGKDNKIDDITCTFGKAFYTADREILMERR